MRTALAPNPVEIVGFGDFKLIMPWKLAPIGIFLLRKCRMMMLMCVCTPYTYSHSDIVSIDYSVSSLTGCNLLNYSCRDLLSGRLTSQIPGHDALLAHSLHTRH